jgi:hypothetical protein
MQVPKLLEYVKEVSKPDWQPDSALKACFICDQTFSYFGRHHCRACGRLVCEKCSKNKCSFPQFGEEKEERICDKCFPHQKSLLTNLQKLRDFNVEISNLDEIFKDADENYFLDLQKGENFYKYDAKKGKVSVKTISLDEDLQNIVISKDKIGAIPTKIGVFSITQILEGAVSESFKTYRAKQPLKGAESVCFSIVYKDGCLDLQMENGSTKGARLWVNGLQKLLEFRNLLQKLKTTLQGSKQVLQEYNQALEKLKSMAFQNPTSPSDEKRKGSAIQKRATKSDLNNTKDVLNNSKNQLQTNIETLQRIEDKTDQMKNVAQDNLSLATQLRMEMEKK